MSEIVVIKPENEPVEDPVEQPVPEPVADPGDAAVEQSRIEAARDVAVAEIAAAVALAQQEGETWRNQTEQRLLSMTTTLEGLTAATEAIPSILKRLPPEPTEPDPSPSPIPAPLTDISQTENPDNDAPKARRAGLFGKRQKPHRWM